MVAVAKQQPLAEKPVRPMKSACMLPLHIESRGKPWLIDCVDLYCIGNSVISQ
jgi:hypothetical protein